MNPHLHFKVPGDELKYGTLDHRIRFFLELACLWSSERNAPIITVTDINTPGVHSEQSVHYDLRGVDLRLAPLGISKWEEFGTWVNDTFDYGRGFSVVLVGVLDPKGGHNDHVHIQVPPPYRQDWKIRLW